MIEPLATPSVKSPPAAIPRHRLLPPLTEADVKILNSSSFVHIMRESSTSLSRTLPLSPLPPSGYFFNPSGLDIAVHRVHLQRVLPLKSAFKKKTSSKVSEHFKARVHIPEATQAISEAEIEHVRVTLIKRAEMAILTLEQKLRLLRGVYQKDALDSEEGLKRVRQIYMKVVSDEFKNIASEIEITPEFEGQCVQISAAVENYPLESISQIESKEKKEYSDFKTIQKEFAAWFSTHTATAVAQVALRYKFRPQSSSIEIPGRESEEVSSKREHAQAERLTKQQLREEFEKTFASQFASILASKSLGLESKGAPYKQLIRATLGQSYSVLCANLQKAADNAKSQEKEADKSKLPFKKPRDAVKVKFAAKQREENINIDPQGGKDGEIFIEAQMEAILKSVDKKMSAWKKESKTKEEVEILARRQISEEFEKNIALNMSKVIYPPI